MPRRVFKRLSRSRHAWQARWFLRPFRRILENPAYWSLNRRNVTRAFALGLAVSFIPLPIHVILAALLALLFGLNLPAAITAVFFTNPLTVVPLFFFAYWIGAKLLDTPLVPFQFELSFEWLSTGLLPIWKPFLLGCLVLGLATAAVGRPSGSVSTRCIRAASSGACVTITSAVPRSRFSSSISSNTPRAFAPSRLPVGSSASTTSGRVTSARATAARCLSPPEG